MRVILSSFLACLLSLSYGMSAAIALDKETGAQLIELERKYFSHTFENDTDEERVARLEKLVFGSVDEGSAEQRIKNMASATFDPLAPQPGQSTQQQSQPLTMDEPAGDSDAPTSQPPPQTAAPKTTSRAASTAAANAHGATKDKSKTASAPASTSKPAQSGKAVPQAPAERPVQTASDDPDEDTSKTQYPHVTALERDILGQTYESDDVVARLARLETKAFGKASKLSDLGDRTDDLDQYVTAKLHKDEPVPTHTGADDDMSTTVPVPADQGTYPRITALESAILNKTYTGEPLTARISRMEVKAFGKSSEDPDLGGRTDKLERYASTKLHKKLHDERTETANGGSQSGSKAAGMVEKQMLAMAGNLLLGMAGINRFGFGGIGMPSGLGPGMYNSTNGGTGMGMGVGGFGIGAGGRRGQGQGQGQQSAQQKQPPTTEDLPENKKEDRVMLANEPPPATARLISKVGWCEMQMYGQTFSEMHLGERLVQLNKQLGVAPGKSGVELMDRINDIVKAVDSHRQPLRSAAQQSTTH